MAAAPPPVPCKVDEAVNELLSSDLSYRGEEVSSSVVAYDRALVSIPEAGGRPPRVEDVLDPKGRDIFVGFNEHLLRTPEDWGNLCETSEPVRPYMDVMLRESRPLYEQFIGDLWRRGMLRFTVRPADLVTPFFVKKKMANNA